MTPTGCHLTPALDGRRLMDGWWRREGKARKKFREEVGDHGRDGARILLVDTETDAELARYLTDAPPA
ncbi:hypothetical protein AB0N87_13595 [Streptomyces sp. NPDC093228]|uniref:hypothetical protein n=1 Tax=unclassified Streptomyces TaxID=2593676 RepID=UPI0007412CA4|nr:MULTISPECIES: hypothetical protein [unclassified Streptomyces]KUJ43034.1 hypothetical protein ADL25_12865 [Streptomyces sp. NRRL F-5122]MDX3262605.1 hypothetical protein [Streptomyces sp. MI02-2A]REE61069.1 hypothetical protein BX257_3632 [Streptomyces sp. 3212.3]